MANDDDDRKASWSSWFAPGDTRHASNQDTDVKRSAPVVSPSETQEPPKSETNPLISFKHFVDDAFSAVTNFQKRARDVHEALEDEHDKVYKRWTGAENTHVLIQIQGAWAKGTKAHVEVMGRPSDEARASARMLLLESARRNSHVSPSKITALFEDPVGDHPHWLGVDWFKSSPDSPVNLEADPALAKYDTKWRHAFEDLLEAALDKPMTSREKFGYRGSIGPTSTWRGPGLDWMLSLQCRGILPPQLPTMYSNATAASELFAREGLSHTMLGRWCQQHSPASKPELWERVRIKSEYIELLEAIDTPAPEDTTFVYDKLQALGIPFHPVTGGDATGADKIESLLRRNLTQHATTQDSSPGERSDELGRAVNEAIKSSHEPVTELDIYEQMYNDWVQDSTHQSDESEHSSSGARCPDELGRAVGDAARQEAARAFADEENGLVDCDAGVVADDTSSGNDAHLDYQMQLKLLDEQTKRLAMARAESSANEKRLADREAAAMARLEQRLAEWRRLQQELDATAWPHRDASDVANPHAARAFADDEDTLSTASERSSALTGWASDSVVECMTRWLETLQSDQDSIKVEHKFYLDQLAEQLQALRDDHEELTEELADALEKLEHKSRMLEQKDRRSALAHPQEVPPAQADTHRPQVLSTLTTTETTRLPDGSVKTTVVLKRRFAGGLEETQESTQTSFEEPGAPASVQEPSKKGWFWS
ncbi:hypothetical protein MBLNU13_g02251t1 [Cladosporium sp. NU13]